MFIYKLYINGNYKPGLSLTTPVHCSGLCKHGSYTCHWGAFEMFLYVLVLRLLELISVFAEKRTPTLYKVNS